ncbi:hypothetical protein [Saccharothrix sp. ST-888]|uniref:hypothetical protein n=1 Tax=Saccharothrix sp. ST-888 TaxID=1427391 RepID=UPI0005EC19BF|nr:hypothetical protein [Saccharothrix sp. ST-888]KJK58470.1 hypothetical protein UK12_10035 [Saccharothrix sp. ST-888]
MHRIGKTTIAVAGALVAAVGFAASPAAAAGTWTATPGGAWTAKATSPVLTDNSTGTQLNCSSSSAAGTLQSGSGLSGTGISSITSVAWASCTGPIGITFSVTSQGTPWALNAVSYNATTGVTTGTITGVKAHISGAGCTADFGGATAGSTATLNATYTNSTRTLAVSGGNLHAYNVSGSCLGLLNSGDAATYTAKYVLNSAQTITSP